MKSQQKETVKIMRLKEISQKTSVKKMLLFADKFLANASRITVKGETGQYLLNMCSSTENFLQPEKSLVFFHLTGDIRTH